MHSYVEIEPIVRGFYQIRSLKIEYNRIAISIALNLGILIFNYDYSKKENIYSISKQQ